MTDEELVRLAVAGRASALEELARRWAPRVLAMCRVRVGPGAAEDLAQESLLRAFQSLTRLEHPERFGGWLRAIALRVCVDWLRRRRHVERSWSSLPETASLHDAVAATGNDELSKSEDDRQRLWDAIRRLPEDLQETLVLCYCDNLTGDAVARLLDVSRTTVNNRLARAREQLRRELRALKES